jgi:hypothetical protein
MSPVIESSRFCLHFDSDGTPRGALDTTLGVAFVPASEDVVIVDSASVPPKLKKPSEIVAPGLAFSITFSAFFAFVFDRGTDLVAGGFFWNAGREAFGAKKYLEPEDVWTTALSTASPIIGEVVIDSPSLYALEPNTNFVRYLAQNTIGNWKGKYVLT